MKVEEMDRVLESSRAQISREVRTMMEALRPSDFTVSELIALIAVLRPVHQRHLAEQAPQGRVLELVRGTPPRQR